MREQNPAAIFDGRIAAQLASPTVTTPRKRLFGGAVSPPAAPKPGAISAGRFLLQSEQVIAELSQLPTVAGPGVIPG